MTGHFFSVPFLIVPILPDPNLIASTFFYHLLLFLKQLNIHGRRKRDMNVPVDVDYFVFEILECGLDVIKKISTYLTKAFVLKSDFARSDQSYS